MVAKVNKTKVINAAQKFVQKGQYERAIREYARIVDEDPRDVRIWLKIGDLWAKHGDQRQAVDTYLKVAEFYSEQGFYLKAVAVYKQILNIDSTQVNINLKLAELYRQLGLLNDAIQQYERVASYFQQQERGKDAIGALRQVVELAPENVATRIKLAELCSKEQLRAEAVVEFTQAADQLRAAGRIDDFIKVAERLVYHDPEQVAVVKELAALYLRRRDPRRALQKLQVAFKADPRDEDTLQHLAEAFQDLGQVPKTISVLKELARIQREGGRPERATVTFERVLELAPDDAEARSALGSAVGAAGRSRSSLQPALPALNSDEMPALPVVVERISPPTTGSAAHAPLPQSPTLVEVPAPLTALPSDERAENAARIVAEADVYIKYGLLDKAVGHLRQVFGYEPENIEARLRLADLYRQLGRPGAASTELLSVARTIAAEDPLGASRQLHDALSLDPGNADARALLARLDGGAAGLGGRGPAEELDQETIDITDGLDAVGSIDLEAEDIVEEIVVESSGLYRPDDPRIGLDTDVQATAVGAAAEVLNIELEEFEEGTGSIAVRGEAVDTLGGVTPTSDVIQLPLQAGRDLLQERLQRQEAAGTGLADDLEEADFFIQQALFAEARAILTELATRYPGHPLIEGKFSEVEAMQSQQGPAPSASAETSAAAHDLAAALASELSLHGASTNESVAESTYELDDGLQDVKQGVTAHGVQVEDYDTHYDLGIAYREMGLQDDAIGQFRIAMRAPAKEVLCHLMVGLCLRDKGELAEAINELKTGLYVEGISEREAVALYFELGQSYDQFDDDAEALYYYEKVLKRDPTFREASDRVAILRERLGATDRDGESAAMHDDDAGASATFPAPRT
ncbi:MAG: tetratricopeptide repeat protein [Proteobacteria bacterium]|nr:tetratricopeptide repeat protein [Pseudomonadota bacterium]